MLYHVFDNDQGDASKENFLFSFERNEEMESDNVISHQGKNYLVSFMDSGYKSIFGMEINVIFAYEIGAIFSSGQDRV